MNEMNEMNEPMVTITLDEFEGLIATQERMNLLCDYIDRENVHDAETYGLERSGLNNRTIKTIIGYTDNIGGINSALERYKKEHEGEPDALSI